jgi:hypothetical protein
VSSQVMNARAPRWQFWQVHYLALAAVQTRPFLLPPSQREEGWNATAEVLCRDSTAEGPRSAVARSGSACKNRFMKMMKEHKVCCTAIEADSSLHPTERGDPIAHEDRRS